MAVIYKDDFLNRVLADPDPYLAKDIQQPPTAVVGEAADAFVMDVAIAEQEHYKVAGPTQPYYSGTGAQQAHRPAYSRQVLSATDPDPVRVLALDYAVKIGAVSPGYDFRTILKMARDVEKFLRGMVDIKE